MIAKVLLTVALVAVAVAPAAATPVRGKTLSLTPPMGWMSWEIFRCEVDCATNPTSCINADLYQSSADALASGGFLAAGYDTIHIDDCWERKEPARDPSTGRLVANSTRFPKGIKGVADYAHSKGVKFGLYTAESPTTCGGYPASANHEPLDVQTFTEWEIDYLKVDGCGDTGYYEHGYEAMGNALYGSSRDIVYSCSWPAYLGANESTKPYDTMIADHCNLWRNYRDIQCNFGSLFDIINHWGEYGPVLKKYAGPGHWNDPDMLLIGNTCITDDEARTQMAIWSIVAAPLIMGNDVRNMSASTRDILLNKDAIAVNQDPKGEQGLRIFNSSTYDVWARNLSNGDVAVGLFNKGGECPEWNITTGGYFDESGVPNKCFENMDLNQLLAMCCADDKCAGASYDAVHELGCIKRDTKGGFVPSSSYNGFYKPSPNTPTGMQLTINFADVGLSGTVEVYDIWQQKVVAKTTGSYTTNVDSHNTAFLRLSRA